MDRKRCSRCKEEKDITHYFHDKHSKDNYYYTCKECVKEYQMENKEDIAYYQKKYGDAHREHLNEYARQYRKTHPKTKKEKVKLNG
jgi:hypothetical protein